VGMNLTEMSLPLVRRRSAENTYSHAGGVVSILASTGDTGGAFALIDSLDHAGHEPVLHVHEREDLLIYVLEGRIDVMLGEEWKQLKQGDSIFLPRGVPHTYRVRTPVARSITLITPGGFEEWFWKLGKPVSVFGFPDKATRPTEEEFVRMLEVGERLGVRLLPESTPF